MKAKFILPTRKRIRSVLDPCAKKLLKMDDKKLPMEDIHEWLMRQNINVTVRTIYRYLEKLRCACFERNFLPQISTAARQCKKLEKAFKKNPPPGLEMLIKLIQLLIWNINTQKAPSAAQIALAHRLLNTVIRFTGDKAGKGFTERQVKLAEIQSHELIKSEQAKALRYCLKETKKFPQVQALFKKAIVALRAAETARLIRLAENHRTKIDAN